MQPLAVAGDGGGAVPQPPAVAGGNVDQDGAEAAERLHLPDTPDSPPPPPPGEEEGTQTPVHQPLAAGEAGAHTGFWWDQEGEQFAHDDQRTPPGARGGESVRQPVLPSPGGPRRKPPVPTPRTPAAAPTWSTVTAGAARRLQFGTAVSTQPSPSPTGDLRNTPERQDRIRTVLDHAVRTRLPRVEEIPTPARLRPVPPPPPPERRDSLPTATGTKPKTGRPKRKPKSTRDEENFHYYAIQLLHEVKQQTSN